MPEEMVNTGAVTETEPTEKTSYTKEEVDALLQQETDRRVTQALKKQAEKQAAKMKEAEKLAQMSAEDQYRYQLEQREKALEEKERQFTLSENRSAAKDVLAAKGLDLSLVDFVVAEDAETMQNNINLLERAFKKSVKAEVEKRLAAKSPQTTTVDVDKSYTAKDFATMTLQQIQELYAAQPDTFK